MPIVVSSQPEHFDLKTAPPDGYVVIKRMSHGEKIDRRALNSKMEMEVKRGSKDARSVVDLFKAELTYFDFAHCIVDHNLQDADERPLNFQNRADVRKIDGKVAEEIDTYIGRVNNFEEDEDAGK